MKTCPRCGGAATVWRRSLFSGVCHDCLAKAEAEKSKEPERFIGSIWFYLLAIVAIKGVAVLVYLANR